MALTLLRHAALATEHCNRYNGWTDISIDMTLLDTRKVEKLMQASYGSIYSSDLKRCRQTVEAMGFSHYSTDKRLREVRFRAAIEGRSFDEIRQLDSYDERYLESREKWHNYACHESQVDFTARIHSFLISLPTNQDILICSHGGTLREMAKLLGHDEMHLDYLEYTRHNHFLH